MSWMIDATLAVLAGGRSRRMGTPKALLPIAGTTLIEWLVDRLAPEFGHLLVAGGDPATVPAGLHGAMVADIHGGAGPMAGIEAALAASPYATIVAVACDMPAVTPALLARLAAAAAGHDAAVPRLDGRPEPACAAYGRSALAPISAALDADTRRAADVLAAIDVRWLDDEDPAHFLNLNTPDDYRRLIDAMR